MRLRGKVAVITGAGSGLGRATAQLFHSEGAKVVLGDVSGQQDETAAELGDGAVAVQVDVTDRAQVDALIATAIDTFGALDAVANVAGIDGPLVPATQFTEDDFDSVLEVNLKGPLRVMQAAIPVMIERGGGSIVNVASSGAVKAYPYMGAYAASKAGLIALSRTFAVENVAHGIRVNVVNPGAIDTPLARALPQEFQDAAISGTPIQRYAAPREIAEAILFLASDASTFALASVFTMDGGMTA